MNALGTAIRSSLRTAVAGVPLLRPVTAAHVVGGWWVLHGECGLGCHVAPR